MSIKIAIGIQKGGTGKTTTAVCVAGALTIMKYRVLLVDVDPQANASMSLGVDADRDENIKYTTNEILTDKKIAIEEAIYQTPVGIDIIPANIQLAKAEKLLLGETSNKKLFRKIQELEKLGETNPDYSYDFIIYDCPPSLGSLTLNALAAADWVIAPVNSENFAEKGLSDFLETVEDVRLEVNENLRFMGVVVTLYKGIKTHKDVLANLRESLGGKVFKTVISNRAILTEIASKGPIQAYAPTSDSAAEYKALALEVESYVK